MALDFFKKEEKKHDPQNEAEKIIVRAHRKSEQLLEEATKEAELIISQTQEFRTEIQKRMKEDIAYQANQFAQGYQALLPEIKKDYKDGVDVQLKIFRDQLAQVTSEVKTALQQKVEELNVLLKEQTLQEFTMVQKELEEYKKQKMADVDDAVKAVVKKAAVEVIGKSISTADHAELVMKAIDKAKKEGVFEK